MSKQAIPATTTPQETIMKDSILSRFDVQKQKDKEMVRGKFINHETPGGNVGFPFKKYKGDAIVTYKFQDGEVYTIPLMVARHLNTNCSYPAYNYKNDEFGRPQMSISEKIRRFSFQSLEFFDKDISSVQNVDHSILPKA